MKTSHIFLKYDSRLKSSHNTANTLYLAGKYSNNANTYVSVKFKNVQVQ